MRTRTVSSLIASLVVSLPLAAQAVTVSPAIDPVSYTYLVAPNNSGSFSYADESGQDLIDGVSASGSWRTQEVPDRNGPNIGWYQVNPTIAFTFDQAYDFSSIKMNIQDTAGDGGVGIANGIVISDGDNDVIYNITSQGANGAVDLPFDISALNATDTLTVTVNRFYNWTFLSEFSFEGTVAAVDTAAVPLPAGLPMLLAGLGGLALVRRRKG